MEWIAGLLGAIVLFLAFVTYAYYRARKGRAREELADALGAARRWNERLGGQVLSLSGGDNPAALQALADASERYNAAGGQLEQARTVTQAALAGQTALEGLHYVAAARSALGLDPGPALPATPEQRAAGTVTENREVTVEGHHLATAPQPGPATTHYYPGGMVAGRPVPRGWYSEPFWRPALTGGAWGLGAGLLFGSLFGGMAGLGWAAAASSWDDGDGDDYDGDGDYDGADAGYDDGSTFASDDFGDSGGGDFGGGDFGGGDFGGGDFGGDF